MEKKAKAEAKRQRRNQRKLELKEGASHPEEAELGAPEADAIDPKGS